LRLIRLIRAEPPPLRVRIVLFGSEGVAGDATEGSFRFRVSVRSLDASCACSRSRRPRGARLLQREIRRACSSSCQRAADEERRRQRPRVGESQAEVPLQRTKVPHPRRAPAQRPLSLTVDSTFRTVVEVPFRGVSSSTGHEGDDDCGPDRPIHQRRLLRNWVFTDSTGNAGSANERTPGLVALAGFDPREDPPPERD
jgi:hypothetical protein